MEDAAVLVDVEAVDAVLEVLEVLDAVVDEVPDVLLIPSADKAASSAVNSGLPLAELVDADEDEVDEDAASHPESPLERRVAPTESRLVPVCAPLTL